MLVIIVVALHANVFIFFSMSLFKCVFVFFVLHINGCYMVQSFLSFRLSYKPNVNKWPRIWGCLMFVSTFIFLEIETK